MALLERLPIRSFVLVCTAVGILARLFPLMSDLLTVNSVSEDGYLMLTVGRNLALGLGLTTAAGTSPTNGVQPLVTFLWAGVHAVTGGDRLPALQLIVLLEFVISVLAGLGIWRLARHLVRDHPAREVVAMLAGAIWFASPLTVRHTTNGLETGVYALGIVTVLLLDRWWVESERRARPLFIGALLGLLFLVRNDAVFFIAALLAVDVLSRSPTPAWVRVRDALAAGLVAMAVASPWLAFNLARFGNIVPVSGRAQSLDYRLAESLIVLPRVVAEYVAMLGVFPVLLSREPALAVLVAIATAAVLLAIFAGRKRLGLADGREARILLLFVGALAFYYSCFFSASHFLSRYLFPFSILTSTWLAISLGASAQRWPRAATACATAAFALMLLAHGRAFARADRHAHMQGVRWVQTHLTDDTWVGAPQSGTLGYFHDRTINLDGKVNSSALQARRDKRLFRYIVEDTPIDYIVDVVTLARWIERPEGMPEERESGVLPARFELLVKDPATDLTVLRRRGAGSGPGRE